LSSVGSHFNAWDKEKNFCIDSEDLAAFQPVRIIHN